MLRQYLLTNITEKVRCEDIKSDFLRKPADLVLGFYEIGS